jgi:hypothetical protein
VAKVVHLYKVSEVKDAVAFEKKLVLETLGGQ